MTRTEVPDDQMPFQRDLQTKLVEKLTVVMTHLFDDMVRLDKVLNQRFSDIDDLLTIVLEARAIVEEGLSHFTKVQPPPSPTTEKSGVVQ